jgi:hypothetical protein
VTFPQHRWPLLGFKGELKSGKSAVAEMLRRHAGSHYDRTSDLEFSDPIIEAANLALDSGTRVPERFREELRLGAAEVLRLNGPMPPLGGYYHTHGGTAKCPECVMKDWLRGVPQGFQLTRDNKDVHRAVLMWLGVIIRQPAAAGVLRRRQPQPAAGKLTRNPGGASSWVFSCPGVQ